MKQKNLLFSNLEILPPDPIFGLSKIFNEDQREEKINLGVGTYHTESGKTWLMPSVLEAEKQLVGASKEYLPIGGDPEFCCLAENLVLKEAAKSVATVQTLGGCFALRLGADLLLHHLGKKTVWVSDPAWPNHASIFSQAGHFVKSYPYYNFSKNTLDFEAIINSVEKCNPLDIFVLHLSCHNPTGLDFSKEQWDFLFKKMLEKDAIAFFDTAYFGFGDFFEVERYPLLSAAKMGLPFLLATSFSKNFGLYNERVGILSVTTLEKEALKSWMEKFVRSSYSNPPAHGARIVRTILKDSFLSAQWKEEVFSIRTRLQTIRKRLAQELEEKFNRDFSYVRDGKGLFCFIGLSEKEVMQLREKHAIYLPKSGRVNLVGINDGNRAIFLAALEDIWS